MTTATWPLYALYERRLVIQVSRRPPPRHVGIILDGNRRYARREGLPHMAHAYRLGAEKLDQVIEQCAQLSIPAVTLWVCSTDNLGRPPEEVTGILGAVEDKMRSLVDDPHVHRNRVKVQGIGRLALLPPSVQDAIRTAEAATKGYDGLLLSIAVA